MGHAEMYAAHLQRRLHSQENNVQRGWTGEEALLFTGLILLKKSVISVRILMRLFYIVCVGLCDTHLPIIWRW